jgi:small ubiquitin-related modifier
VNLKPDGEEDNDNKAALKSDHINLRVQSQDGSTVHFKIKKNTPMKKLMQAYCDRKGIRMDSIRFVFDGTIITSDHTPVQLEMEEDDCIEVFQQQTGGI